MKTLTTTIRVLVGALFLAAAILKLFAGPVFILASVGYVLQPLVRAEWQAAPAYGYTVRALVVLLVATEAALGIALLTSSRPVWRGVAAAALLIFAVILATRFTVSNAPPCGCLGIAVHESFKHGVWLDVARNVLLASALLLSVVWAASGGAGGPVPAPASRGNGFTLIETLVVILVITVICGLAFPALSSARHSAKISRSLSNQRQIVTAITAYAASAKDSLPNFGSDKGLGGAIVVNGVMFRNGYFRTHMTAWPALVCPADLGMLAMLRAPSDTSVLDGTDPLHHVTLYWMTATAFGDPVLFDGAHETAAQITRNMLQGQRLSSVRQPDKKGMVLDMQLRPASLNGAALMATKTDITGFADGSVAHLGLPATTPPPAEPEYTGAMHGRVLTTRDGINGRDR